MEQNKNSTLGQLEKLAMIVDSLQVLFKGKSTIAFELDKEEYSQVISHFREIDRNHKQFSINISGTELYFLLNEDK